MASIFRRAAAVAAACFLCFAGQAAAEDEAPFTGVAINDQPMAENLCAITFDDGPSKWTTPHLLDMLDNYGIKATFFMLGRNASCFPDIVKRALESGHEIGSHSFSHPNLKAVSQEKRAYELGHTDEILRGYGINYRFFRPPYGNFNAGVREVADKLGIRIVTWSMDSLDWKRLPEDYSLIQDAHGRVSAPGKLHGIFLFHDIHERTVNDFPRIVADLKKGGCDRFVTVSEYADNLYLDTEPPLLMDRRPEGDWKQLRAWKGFDSDPVTVKPVAALTPVTDSQDADVQQKPAAEASQTPSQADAAVSATPDAK